MMQALRQFSEQLGLFLNGFGDCHGWVPSVVRADYGTGRILTICSLDSISRCAVAADLFEEVLSVEAPCSAKALAQRKPAKGEQPQPACIPNRPNLSRRMRRSSRPLSHLKAGTVR